MLYVKLKLKIIWSNNFLGLGVDQINTKQAIPLTNYFFWPKTEAWEQLKLELDSKQWIKTKDKVKILNTAADVMNFWRTNRNSDAFENIIPQVRDVNFVKIKT